MKKTVVLLTMAFPFLLHAQGFQVNLQGQKQQGMGGTGTAFIQDGASLFFNPGGVSFLKQNSFSAGITPVISHAKFADDQSSTVSSTTSPVSYPFTSYLVLGARESRLKYGLGVYTPFGSTIDWESGWTGRFVLTHLQLTSVFFQPTVSYKLSDQLGIGVGFVYGIGHVNLQRDMPVQDANGKYGHATLNGNAHGMGVNAGIYYQPTSDFSLGFNYRSGVNMKLTSGDATFKVPASLASSFPSGKFSTTLPLPAVYTLGASWAASKALRLALDVSMINWDKFDTLRFNYENHTTQLQDTRSPRLYQNAWSYRLGAQYAVNDQFDVRAGIKYLVTPVRDGYVSPDVPDATHFNYSVGLGYKIGDHFVVDASFTYENMKRTATNAESQLNGKYNTKLFLPGISLSYKF